MLRNATIKTDSGKNSSLNELKNKVKEKVRNVLDIPPEEVAFLKLLREYEQYLGQEDKEFLAKKKKKLEKQERQEKRREETYQHLLGVFGLSDKPETVAQQVATPTERAPESKAKSSPVVVSSTPSASATVMAEPLEQSRRLTGKY